MPRRSRDNQGKFLPKTPTPPNNQPSLLFDDCELPSLSMGELEDHQGEKPKIFEEPIGKKKNPLHLPKLWLKTRTMRFSLSERRMERLE